jgi:membrane protease YdiL (CAAX protease family)
MVALAVAVEGSLGLLAVGLGLLVDHSPLRTLKASTGQLQAVVWGGLAALPMLGVLLVARRRGVGPIARLLEEVQHLTHSLFSGCSVWQLALVCLAAGLGEELLFRGLVQDGLARWLGPPFGNGVGLLVASAVFGLAHPVSRRYVVVAAVSGLWLGGLLIVTDTLLVPIVTHALYDLGALVFFLRWPTDQDSGPPETGE